MTLPQVVLRNRLVSMLVAALGNPQGLDCNHLGVSKRYLPIRKGFWRANLSDLATRECLNRVSACVPQELRE